jgi:hypothetical protein
MFSSLTATLVKNLKVEAMQFRSVCQEKYLIHPQIPNRPRPAVQTLQAKMVFGWQPVNPHPLHSSLHSKQSQAGQG